MKKSFLIMCSLLLSNFFISCSSEDTASNIDEEKVQFVLQSKSTEVTKAAYQLLTPEEKHFIWDERIDYILSHEDLTVQQVNFINELKSDLNSSSFQENSSENQVLKTKYDNTKISVFEPIQAYYYFGTLTNMAAKGTWSSIADGGQQGKLDFYYSSIGLVSGSLKSCNCNGDSIYDVDCTVACSSSTNTNSGCGVLWLWPCEYREK